MIIEAEGYRFDFKDAVEVIDFDKTTEMPMKAVDIVAEFADKYVFVEIKEYGENYDNQCKCPIDGTECDKKTHLKWLKNYLNYKFRDTFLYRFAEGKVDKPITYLCLLNLDHALSGRLAKELRYELPTKIRRGKTWRRDICSSCHVLNLDRWNTNFPQWPAKKLPETNS